MDGKALSPTVCTTLRSTRSRAQRLAEASLRLPPSSLADLSRHHQASLERCRLWVACWLTVRPFVSLAGQIARLHFLTRFNPSPPAAASPRRRPSSLADLSRHHQASLERSPLLIVSFSVALVRLATLSKIPSAHRHVLLHHPVIR